MTVEVDLPGGDWSAFTTDELIKKVIATEPGPAAIMMLAELAQNPLSPRSSLLLLRAWEKQAAWMAAQQQAAVLTAAGPVPDPDELQEDEARVEVADAIRLSESAAHRRIACARALASPELAAAQAAFESGRITYLHALTLVEETERLTAHQRGTVCDRVLPRAPEQTLAQFRRAVRRAVALVDTVQLEVAHAAAHAQRTVEWFPEPDGMASLHVTGSAPDIKLIYAALTSSATAGPLPEGVDAARVDVLLGWAKAALARLPDPVATDRTGHAVAEIQVVTDLPTLLGLADHPGWLTGYGPIPASVTRALAGDARWTRFLTDPVSGQLLDRGRHSYRPSKALAQYVVARDRMCRFPGCSRAAHRCDLDHIAPFPAGQTTRANLAPLCRRHHRLKTHSQWQVRRDLTDNSIVWTSPTGNRYVVPAVRYPPDG